MKYRVMRMMCMFDLPMETEKEKRAYRIFRKNIIREGFYMMQYSIYVRTCPNRDFCKRLQKRIEKFLPENGNVRLLIVTEKQYEDMKLLVGCKNQTESKIGQRRFIVI